MYFLEVETRERIFVLQDVSRRRCHRLPIFAETFEDVGDVCQLFALLFAQFVTSFEFVEIEPHDTFKTLQPIRFNFFCAHLDFNLWGRFARPLVDVS